MNTQERRQYDPDHVTREPQEYGELLSWLHRYGNGSVHWTVFADLDLTQQASGALTDLHRLLRQGSDEEILEFFNNARSDMRSEVKTYVDGPGDRTLMRWAVPTD
ncbi:MAG TPA: hypothetical protein VK973_16900 [Arenicellales bacterium]|nr:hypothetical protein [Arenicellales bacterium]